MSRPDSLVPMWIQQSGIAILDRMPRRPVLIEVDALGTVLHGQVIELSMCTARVRPDDPLFLWKNVKVAVRFRYSDVVYALEGTASTTHADESFTFDFDRVSRQRMEILHAQLKTGGYLCSDEEEMASSPCEEEEAPEAARPKTKQELCAVHHGPAPEGQERRVHDRHTLLVTGTVQRVSHSSILKCQVLEVSLGGCRIYTDHPNTLTLGDQVEVQFVGCGFPFRLAARVQFVLEAHVAGLKFLHMSMRTSERLLDLVRELREKKTSPLLS